MILTKLSETEEQEDGRKFVEHQFYFAAETDEEKLFCSHIRQALKESTAVVLAPSNTGVVVSFVEEA